MPLGAGQLVASRDTQGFQPDTNTRINSAVIAEKLGLRRVELEPIPDGPPGTSTNRFLWGDVHLGNCLERRT